MSTSASGCWLPPTPTLVQESSTCAAPCWRAAPAAARRGGRHVSGGHCPTCSCTVSADTAPGPQKPCAGFRWNGQPFSSCDRCGLPYWEHSHEERLNREAGPFSSDPFELVPITPESAEACRRKWGPR